MVSNTTVLGYADLEPAVVYDKNGNIKSISRTGQAAGTYAYTYNGNQIKTVNSLNYAFDGNGNTTIDGIRALNIGYNYLNLTGSVTGSGIAQTYTYDASGQKLEFTSSAGTTKYAGVFEYDGNNAISRVNITDGQARAQFGITIVYEYYHKDHLGNVGSMIDEAGNTLQRTDYYGFGKEIIRSGSGNKYLYNGKEKQDGTGYLDYGARFYDSTVPHFLTVDPLADHPNQLGISPYAFSQNNPINMIDPDGNFPYPVTIRSFAPVGAFSGTGFHDDGRSFSSRSDVTSRISQSFTVDPTARTFSGGNATSSPTKWIGGLSLTATDEGSASATFSNSKNGNVASVASEFEGSNPFFAGAAPNIAVSSNLTLTENIEKGTLGVSINLSSKQFPATEATIQDSKKNSIFLGGAAAFGTPGNLVRGEKTPVQSVNLSINIDKNGVFQSVIFQNKTYSISDFNKTFTPSSAGPFPREDKDK